MNRRNNIIIPYVLGTSGNLSMMSFENGSLTHEHFFHLFNFCEDELRLHYAL